MALQNLEFEFKSENTQTINPEWSHMGVTGSGDLEVMFTKKDLGGKVQAKVCTPVVGFDAVWEKMLGKFVNDTGVGNIVIEINDDNATPIVVYTRLRQALAEATGGETFISKIPSFKITDLAEAMMPGCKIKEIGIRPGEKLHEIMVTTEDSLTTYEYDKHFIVYPQMTWNNRQQPNLSGKKVAEGFSYSSDNNTDWLSVEDIRTLLKDVELEK